VSAGCSQSPVSRFVPLAECGQAGAGGGIEDGFGVDAVGTVEVGDVARLAKAVDAERDDLAAGDGTEPGQGRRMEVADRDERKVGPPVTSQPI
jgi:hypothetical protein